MASLFFQPTLLPCRVATVANIATINGSAPSTLDGVSLVIQDRILVKNQSTPAQNGIYVVTIVGSGSNGTWVRSNDVPLGSTNALYPGTSIYVAEGATNSRTRMTLVTTGTITVATTALVFISEATLVRTDASTTQIITAGTAFTSGTIVWSSVVDMIDYREISVWFQPATLGSNTTVSLYVQWPANGTTGGLGDTSSIQQTDFLLVLGSDGTFIPRSYVAVLDTSSSTLVAGRQVMLSFPKKGGSFRFGVAGNTASGTFGVQSQRIA